MSYGNRIAELREQRGLTQEELASSIHITRAALSHYEKNRRKPDFEVLTRLADIFDVSIDYLIGRTKQSDVVMDEDVREFVDTLELSDKEVLERFDLMIDGKPLTEEEARRFIAFVRMERSMD
ncbi:MAG: helix-turn-helix domain-containing protein [Paenibacillus sp.]|uniref:helix-turn-helix domain-containing protein n=1 Tax=Paenibacillus sp. TaxID=58172 RepID=UPI003B77632B